MIQESIKVENNELSLREMIVFLWSFVLLLWKNKWWLLLTGVLIGGLSCCLEYLKPVTYTAEMTFMLNEDNGRAVGGVGALLGQFGLGGGNNSEYNLDKIVELSRSRKILQDALLDSVVKDDHQDLLANVLIDVTDLRKKWKTDTSLVDFYFSSDSVLGFNKKEIAVLKQLHAVVIGKPDRGIEGLMKISYQEKTSILSLEVTSEDEVASLDLCENVYKKLSNFYVQKATEKHRFTLENLILKRDSVQRELQRVEYGLANAQDGLLEVIRQGDRVKINKKQREVQVLTIMYGEVLKNIETTDFLLKNSTPFFQEIDRPVLPLGKSQKKYIRSLVIGSVLGVFLVSVMIIVYSLLVQILVDPKSED